MAMVAGEHGVRPSVGPQATFQGKGPGPSILGAATAERALPAPSPTSCLPLTKPKINSVYFHAPGSPALRAQVPGLLLYPHPSAHTSASHQARAGGRAARSWLCGPHQQALQDPGRGAGLALRATLFIKIKVRKQKAPLGDGSVEVSASFLCILSIPHGSVQARWRWTQPPSPVTAVSSPACVVCSWLLPG